jgi:hypothetical protein
MKNKPLPSPPPVQPATQAQVDAFLKGLQRFRAKGIHPDAPLDEVDVKKYDEAGVKAYLDKMTVGAQQGIARRIMMDILKSPTSERAGTRKPTKTKTKTKKKTKASPKTKSKRASKKKRSPAKKKKTSRRR